MLLENSGQKVLTGTQVACVERINSSSRVRSPTAQMIRSSVIGTETSSVAAFLFPLSPTILPFNVGSVMFSCILSLSVIFSPNINQNGSKLQVFPRSYTLLYAPFYPSYMHAHTFFPILLDPRLTGNICPNVYKGVFSFRLFIIKQNLHKRST